jgi:phage terminase large subunit GpA-like protein
VTFADPLAIRRDIAALLRPPEPISPSQAASRYLHIVKPGGAHGLWDPTLTPYARRPMDALLSREKDTVVFIAPAQAGKSSVAEGLLTYAALCAPGDMLIVNPTEDISRDYSIRRLDRMLRDSPDLKRAMSARADADNRFDKHFKSGMIVSLGHPVISHFSGRSIKYVVLSDYDRFPLSIGGEGSAIDLGRKRLTVYGSAGILYVESSIGWDITDPNWRQRTPHEAPPAAGILGAYNGGTKCLWYWTCPDCSKPFEGDFKHLTWEPSDDLNVVKNSVRLACPNCGSLLEHKHKREMNARGEWISEAAIMGLPEQPNTTDSFWLKGTAAAFVDWATLVLRFLKAKKELERTGDENPLRAVTNTDLSLPYLPVAALRARSAEDLMNRAEEWEPGTLPADDIHVAIASADVQGNRFVCAVHGFALRDDGIHTYCLARQEIMWSNRLDAEGRQLPLDPAAHVADWSTLNSLLEFRYGFSEKSRLSVAFLVVDSGGRDGVANAAYQWWRKLGTLRNRVRLVKGEGGQPANAEKRPRVRETLVGGVQLGSTKKPDVPLLLLNANELKDTVAAEMGRLHLPAWLDDKVFEELVAEVKDDKNNWVKVTRAARNEQWDLLYYARAALIYLGADRWGEGWSNIPAMLKRFRTELSVIKESLTPEPAKQPEQPQRVVLKSRKSSALTL